MGKYPLITKLFERRQFNESERQTMRELYQQTEMLAERMAATLPECDETVTAIYKLKDALAMCETAMALHPKCDKQMGLPMCDGEQVGRAFTPREQAEMIEKQAAVRMAEIAREAKHKLDNLPAYARN